ncbi:hypothetical protein QQF64_016215 [Cirrhinus molitorella]|uniref:Uncharacterized protein n=1 Tax=Cirrhinus molitorella TaxID=172907 RepID=A0ABR3LM65_9TELE
MLRKLPGVFHQLRKDGVICQGLTSRCARNHLSFPNMVSATQSEMCQQHETKTGSKGSVCNQSPRPPTPLVGNRKLGGKNRKLHKSESQRWRLLSRETFLYML